MTMKYTRKNTVTRNEDSRLSIISKLAVQRPESAKYAMMLPESVNDMRNMGCSATLTHLHEIIDRKSLAFSVMNLETEELAATIICKMNSDEYLYTYTIKAFEEETSELRDFEKDCVEFAIKTLMRNKRVAVANHNKAHRAYNVLGCAAISV